MAASERRLPLMAALAAAVVGNLVSRRTLGRQLQRVIFDASGDDSLFQGLKDLPTQRQLLTRENLRAALLASGSIPLLMDGVRMPGDLGRMHWDGGVLDYHPDFDFEAGAGLVLYPHFYPYVIPGWFDKALPWRRAGGSNFHRALLISPSEAFVASLPGGKIPDRQDFYRHPDRERMTRWQKVLDGSARLGEELRELMLTGRLAERVQPW